MDQVVLARRMDKGSNHCTEVRKASAGAWGIRNGTLGIRSGTRAQEMLWDMYGSLARHEWCNQCRMSIEKLREEGDQVDFEKLYSEGRGDAEASLFCFRFDQWRCSLQLCAQGRRDGDTTTRKVTYFATHPGGGGGQPSGGVQGTSVRRCRHFGVEVHTLRWEVE
ncbi:hypothetical protein Acr_00g0096090 [Actinidia rufa]|uniref:Uncharacterized protein n=1 Tax=Actinidia rufa TaxID=165716 RepID=A0A7J0DYL2_9ERIC|nr:hypothetical protein Acr_00g0096090 [Actinidia rufa]